MTRVALFGGGGFVSPRVRAMLERQGHRVQVFSRSTRSEGITWDASSPMSDAALNALGQCDAICYLAAYLPRDYEDVSEARACFEVNAFGVLDVLRAASTAGVRYLVYASSAALYSGNAADVVAEGACVHPDKRATSYLTSKLAGELFVQRADHDLRPSAAILRIASVYGPGMTRENAVSRFAKQLAAGQTVTLTNAGSFAADLVHVDDVAAAICACVERQPRGIINIGCGDLTDMRHVATAIAERLHADPALVRIEGESISGMGTPRLDISRARELLQYQPRAFAIGVESVLAGVRDGRLP